MQSFFRGVDEGNFPKLDDRDDLWKLLVTITERKAYHQTKHAHRKKRGGGTVRGDSIFVDRNDSERTNIDGAVAAPDPTPEFAAEISEQLQHLFDKLEDESLRQVAALKIEGYSNDEMAEKKVARNGCSALEIKASEKCLIRLFSTHLNP